MSRKPDLVPHRNFESGHIWSIHSRESFLPEATLAAHIMEKWALVAAIPDGEDSAGRQKLRLPTADELAERACDIVAAAHAQFERRGWILEIPSQEDAKKAWKEKHPDGRHNDDQ